MISTVKSFNYTGGQQTYTIPYTGYYKLEVWGAQGGQVTATSNNYAGYGGYSVGLVKRDESTTLYINVGGQGTATAYGGGGYNGGGNLRAQNGGAAGGGGATHIAAVSGLLQNLSSYKDTGGTNISKEILIVAGAGGGIWTYNGVIGGHGGGYIGTTGFGNNNSAGPGGTQTSGGIPRCRNANSGSFGKGGSVSEGVEGGGGAGWYGGAAGSNSPTSCNFSGSGGGGSGYIGSSNLISGLGITKHMTCYSCTTNTAVATRTNSNTNVSSTATADYSKAGNGYARITWMGDTL